MKEVNTIDVDKYYHCMAHCNASATWAGELTATLIGDLREFTDWIRKGDDSLMCEADQFANRRGRRGKGQDCERRCGVFRPPWFPYPMR
jgi:hypothetical protein